MCFIKVSIYVVHIIYITYIGLPNTLTRFGLEMIVFLCSNVEIVTGDSGGNNWCGTSVEFGLWWVVEVGCAMEGRGRFVRGVCGN